MGQRLIKFLIILLLGVSLFGPAFETVDRWDNFPQKTDDIVLSATAVVTFLAGLVAFALALRRRMPPRPTLSFGLCRPNFLRSVLGPCVLFVPPLNSHSPPLPLRI